jgi:hypothetical protein
MSDLTPLEKRKFEQFLGMETGYVLDFTNRTFAEFVSHSSGSDIYDPRYEYGSGSGGRMRIIAAIYPPEAIRKMSLTASACLREPRRLPTPSGVVTCTHSRLLNGRQSQFEPEGGGVRKFMPYRRPSIIEWQPPMS